MNDIEEDIAWYDYIYEIIENNFFINNMSPEIVAEKLISTFNLRVS